MHYEVTQMQINESTIKRPKLFDSFFNEEIDYKNDFVEYKNVTSNFDYIKKQLSTKKYRIAINSDNLDTDLPFFRGLTWSHEDIDKAFLAAKKLYPDCVIVLAPASA